MNVEIVVENRTVLIMYLMEILQILKYTDLVKPLLQSCMGGINSTIVTYGQTSGKTHTRMDTEKVPEIIL